MQRFSVPRFWRWSSPSCLLVAVISFSLPWIEIGCEGTVLRGPIATVPTATAPTATLPAIPPPSRKRPSIEIGPMLTKSIESLFHRGDYRILVAQSGLQSIYGGYSSSEEDRDHVIPSFMANLQAAPWMLGYALAALVGAAIGFLDGAEPSKRRQIVGTCGATACVILWIHTLCGFPLVLLFNTEMQHSLEIDRTHTFIVFTSWFWLSHLATLGAVILVCWEWWLTRRHHDLRIPQESR